MSGHRSSVRDRKKKRSDVKSGDNIIEAEELKSKNQRVQKGTALTTGTDCMCRLKCFANFSLKDQQTLVNTVNSFKTKDKRDTFLQQHIEKHDVRQRKPRCANPKFRAGTFKYFVSKGGERISVCKRAFVSLYGITDNKVRRLNELLLAGVLPRDERGRNPKPNAISAETCYMIHQHIESFPTKFADDGTKLIKYLDSQLDVKKMHSLFKALHPDLNVKYEFYLGYFNKNFGLPFGRPAE